MKTQDRLFHTTWRPKSVVNTYKTEQEQISDVQMKSSWKVDEKAVKSMRNYTVTQKIPRFLNSESWNPQAFTYQYRINIARNSDSFSTFN